MQSSHPPLVRTRLSALMFLEFFIWGGWGIALAVYSGELGFSETQGSWLMATPALGAIISPLFMGLIADRYFAAERLLAVLHLLGGACLVAAGFQKEFWPMMGLMMLNGLCFMPTLALANSVAFRHIPDPAKFPRIAVLGTIGWIVAVLSASVFLGGMKEPNFLFQSGIAGLVAAVYCLSLPHTPPKGAEGSADVFGLSALKLLRESSFLVFIVCVAMFGVPACGYFFRLVGPMLLQRGYPAPLALTSLCQLSELVFMFSMPWFVTRLGLKRVIAIGMAAWIIRYVCFAQPDFSLALIGLLLHGFCYSFFYVGAYMYVDKRAPAELKASAQSLLAFLLLGVGYFTGTLGGGLMLRGFPADVKSMAAVSAETGDPVKDAKLPGNGAKLPRWDDPRAAESAWRYLDLSATFNELISGKDEQEAESPKKDLAQQLDTDQDGRITLAEIEAFPQQSVEVDELLYAKDDLAGLFRKIADAQQPAERAPADVGLTRTQWLEAQSAKWRPIWLYPALGVLVVFALFIIGFRDKPPEDAPE